MKDAKMQEKLTGDNRDLMTVDRLQHMFCDVAASDDKGLMTVDGPQMLCDVAARAAANGYHSQQHMPLYY